MSFVIAVANAKGGCGKSTVAMLLAGALCKHLSTIVADSDPQGTASLWAGSGAFPAPVQAVTENALATLKSLATQFQAVIVDCPPNVDAPVMRAALSAADLLLIPCAPEPADIWATKILLEMCRVEYPNLPLRVVLTKVPASTALSRDMLTDIVESSWPVTSSRFGLRTAYKEAMALGATLDKVQGKGGRQARDELQDFALEVLTTVSTL
jgi:chromosome partitioning protein